MGTLARQLCSFTLLAITSSIVCGCAAGLPTRQECIVRVISLAPQETHFQQNGLKYLFADASKHKIPLAGVSVANAKVVYVQYKDMCKNRIEMTKMIFADILPLSKIKIDKAMVKPGPKTINIFGPSWSDGSPPWKRKAKGGE